MKINRSLITLGILLGSVTISHATIIGFGQLGGSNATVPAALGSNATADGNGFVVTNGATPNIGLTWDGNWDIHTSNFFSAVESLTAGGGDWDSEGGGPRIGQLDFGDHTIVFSADPGYSLILNSFDFGHTGETPGTTDWDLKLTDSGATVVWETSVQFVNGQEFTVSPGFTGNAGESYTLSFTRTAETYGSNGRHAIDNLSFNQTAVPEPGAISLLGLAGLALVRRRRR